MPDLKNHFIEPGLKKKIWRSLTLARKYQYLCGNIHQYGILETTIILSWFTAVIKLMIGLPWSLKWKMFMENSYLYSDKKNSQHSVWMHVQLNFFNVWIGFLSVYYMWHFSLQWKIWYIEDTIKNIPDAIWGKKI